MQFPPIFQGHSKPTKNLNGIVAELCTARGFGGWLQHSGEISLNDRKVKGSGQGRDLSIVPTGSCNCVCVLGWNSTTRCSAGRITAAINPERSISFRKACYREKLPFFLSHTFWGPNCLMFKGAHLPSGKLATSPVHH
ncbi:hypothetical protein AVEN_166901-1 [Araneus ventricosus]|uniref:Uncharacterized protein n=1 Tax=Araneus ventricosus TaxID=182803 RepID=A0A4Y2EV59_ARAVE|nr:hypothetical protein AVEN_166901-1 [Araneus ventricosus]